MVKKLPNKYGCLAALCIGLLMLNFLVIPNVEIEISRMFRAISLLLIFLFFLYHKGFNQNIIFVAFVIFAMRDIFWVQYEISSNKTVSFLLTITAYLTLILLNIKKLDVSRSTPVIIIFGLCLIALNVFNVYYLSDIIIKGLDTNFQYILFFLQGAVLIVLGFVGFLYNERFTGKTPLVFLYMTFSFIMADLCGLVAYYFKIDAAYYPERVFYILALILLTNYALNKNMQKEQNILEKENDYIL